MHKNVKLEQQRRAARDVRLIDAYRAGRREAFDELVLSYEHHVRRLLGQFNVPVADIEDRTQEVFLRIFRNLHRHANRHLERKRPGHDSARRGARPGV